MAIIDSGGGRIDAGGGVRWWCGHIDDRGGGRVVVMSLTQAVGWSSSLSELLVVAIVDSGGGRIDAGSGVRWWCGCMVMSTMEVVGRWWWLHRRHRWWAGHHCRWSCWADGGGHHRRWVGWSWSCLTLVIVVVVLMMEVVRWWWWWWWWWW